MNHGLGKLGWVSGVALSPYVEYPGSDKRNRNPNWTDTEIARFLTILMEEPVLADLNAQRNKQVFCYVSQKMMTEGCEKSWDQCRVKLKNLKSQWRYVKDRIPDIETVDLDDEEVVKKLGAECQTRGVSPSCIKHLRLLKQFLISLAAVRKGLPPPVFKSETFNFAAALDCDRPNTLLSKSISSSEPSRLFEVKSEEDDSTDARLVVETGISPPTSPEHRLNGVTIVGDDPEDDDDHIVVEGENPLDTNGSSRKRSLDYENTDLPQSKKHVADDTLSSISLVQRFQREMMNKYLQYQRESEMRMVAWDQERWRLEQNMMERWRSERMKQDKEMFSMMCSMMTEFSSAILQTQNK